MFQTSFLDVVFLLVFVNFDIVILGRDTGLQWNGGLGWGWLIPQSTQSHRVPGLLSSRPNWVPGREGPSTQWCRARYRPTVLIPLFAMPSTQGVTKRCRLSWLTRAQMCGKGGSCGVSVNEYSCTQEHRSPNNLGELTPYLSYVSTVTSASGIIHVYRSSW